MSHIRDFSYSMIYRSRAQIVSKMLESAKDLNGVTKTRIMYEAYLSYVQLREYLSVLIENGLLEYAAHTRTYKITPKGIEYLELFEQTKAMGNI